MQQFQCAHCGYDMTGIETVANGLDVAMLSQFTNTLPLGMGGFYTNTMNNTVRCPNCGTVGNWIKG